MEHCGNFTMYAKDCESAGAICLMKVQGNAGGKIDRGVQRDLVNLRIFHMECDIFYRKGRLPACFARGFGLQVGPYVMLRDSNRNEIEVAIEEKNGKVYFADGWSFLKTFYGTVAGAWVTVIYANRHPFLLEVRNFHGDEVVYPRLNPYLKMMLQNLSANDYRNSFVIYSSDALFLPTIFCHTIVKELTSEDVTSNK